MDGSYLSKTVGILGVACLTACASGETVLSDQVDQDTIYQSYSAVYDQEEESLEISAQFRVGGITGTTLELVSPSKIEYGGEELSLSSNSITGTRYTTSIEDTSFVERHEWIYQNNDGDVFTNSLDIPQISLDDISVNIKLNEDLLVEWDGSPLSDNENIRLEIRDQASFLVMASVTQEGATSVTMPKEDLQLLEEGLVKLRLIRTRTWDLDESGPEGGRMRGEYRTRLGSANLIP